MADRFKELIERRRAGRLTPEEQAELRDLAIQERERRASMSRGGVTTSTPLDGLVPPPREGRGEANTGRAFARGAAQGLTLGGADEGAASILAAGDPLSGMMGMGGPTYDAALEVIRGQDREAQEAAPFMYGAGEFTGGAATAAVPGVAGARALQGAPLLVQMLAAGAEGGALAGIQGFASGEGGAEARGANAMANIPWGVGFGAAAPPIARAVGAGAGYVRGLGSPEVAAAGFSRGAGRRVNRALMADGYEGDAGRDAIINYLDQLGPEGMLADLPAARTAAPDISRAAFPGSTQGAARALYTRPGESRSIMSDALDARTRGAGERIRTDMEAQLGPTTAAYDEMMAQRQARAALGGDYEAALSGAGPVDPAGVAVAVDGQMGRGFRVGDTGAQLRRWQQMVVEAGDDPRALHSVRSQLSDYIRGMGDASGRTPSMRAALTPVLESIDATLDAAAPGYAAARAGTRESHDIDRAVEAGQAVFERGTRPDEFAATFARMSPEEQAAVRKGAADAIAEIMGTARYDATSARSLLQRGWNQEKLRTVLGPDAEPIIRRIFAEETFANTNRNVVGGSSTAPSAAAERDLLPPAEGGDNRAGPISRAWGGVNSIGNAIIDELLFAGRPAVTRDMAAIMSATGLDRDALIRALLSDQSRLSAGNRLSAAVSRGLQPALQGVGRGGTAVTAN